MSDIFIDSTNKEWNNPFSLYNKTIKYKWQHIPSGISGERQVRVRQIKEFTDLINHWNLTQKSWLYTILGY